MDVGVLDHPLPESEGDEDWIDTGAAILAFYCTLVDLLGRCAPDSGVIAQVCIFVLKLLQSQVIGHNDNYCFAGKK